MSAADLFLLTSTFFAIFNTLSNCRHGSRAFIHNSNTSRTQTLTPGCFRPLHYLVDYEGVYTVLKTVLTVSLSTVLQIQVCKYSTEH